MTEQMLDGGDDSRRTVLESMPAISRRRFLLRAHAWGELRSHSSMRAIHFALLMVILVAASLAAGCDTPDSPTAVVTEEEFYMTTVPVDQIIDHGQRIGKKFRRCNPVSRSAFGYFRVR